MLTPDNAEEAQIALLEHLPPEDRDAFLAAADSLDPSRAHAGDPG